MDQNFTHFKSNTPKLYPSIKSQPIDLVLDDEYATHSSKVSRPFTLGVIGPQKSTCVDPEARWQNIQGAENRLTNPFVQRQGAPSPLYSKRQSKLCWVKRPTASLDSGKLQEEPRIRAALTNVQCLEEFYQMTDRCNSARGLKGLCANKQQEPSRQQKQNPFLKKTAPVNLGNVLDVLVTRGFNSKTDPTKKKRAQSVPPRQSPSLPKRCAKSDQRPETALTINSAREHSNKVWCTCGVI
eukprot:gi/632971563/ref/XP_007902232.1/ PREDICTED: uncharacterized protein LOC103185502 [Callorhinchus milii]